MAQICDSGGLLSLPQNLLQLLWPAERAVIARKVCRRLRKELPFKEAVIAGRRNVAEAELKGAARDLCAFRESRVSLRWTGAQSASLAWLREVSQSLDSGLTDAIRAIDLQVDTSVGSIEVWAALALVLKQTRSLKCFVLSNSVLEDSGMSELADGFALQTCNLLQHLEFRNCCISINGAVSLAAVIGRCDSLTTLNLGQNDLFSEGAQALCSGLQRAQFLKHLDLSANRIGEAGAKSLAETLTSCTSLTHLSIAANTGIGDLAAADLVSSLSSCPALERLELGAIGGGEFMASGLVIALRDSKKLSHLDLQDNDVSRCRATWMHGIQAVTRLQHLDVSRCGIGSQAVAGMANAINAHPSLACMSLAGNPIGSDGAASLSRVLATLPRLTALDLSECQLQPLGATALSKVLGACTSLQRLQLRANKIGSVAALKILNDKVLGGCEALVELNLSDNGVKLRGVKSPHPHLSILV